MRRDSSGEGPRGTVKTNVPHRVKCGSPDGFEFGYEGSGPSDLALNAVEHLIQTLAEEGIIDFPSDYYTEEYGKALEKFEKQCAEEREKVFEHGHTTAEDGSGLGLSIVSSIVDAHGWNVRVCESETGGARFEVSTA